MSSSSKPDKLTVVEFDLRNSSRSFKDIHTGHNLGEDGLVIYLEQVHEIILKSFNESIKNRAIKPDFTKIVHLIGDGGRLTFESVENAYDFVKIFCAMVDQRNQIPGIYQWCFRIGAATGDVDYDPSRPPGNQMIGNIFMIVKELEAGALPGWLFIDEMTYNELSQDIRNKFSNQIFKNKGGNSINAYSCPMLANSVQSIKPILWTDDSKKQKFIQIISDVFTEEELKTICENNTNKLKGNPYNAISGNTVNARYSSLVNYLIRKGLINSFLEILCQESEYFADLVKSLQE